MVTTKQDNFIPESEDSQEKSEIELSSMTIDNKSGENPKEKRSKFSLRDQLLVTILPTVLVPLAVASFAGYRIVQQNAEERIATDLVNDALLAGEATYELIEGLADFNVTLASNPLIINAARAATERAEAANLQQQPIEEVEAQFSGTRLLQPNQVLNDYLKSAAEAEDLAEIFFTEKYGFNVAYSNPTSDFIQSDEDWWQQGKSEIQYLQSDFELDESSNTISIELVQAIVDPGSEQFLGNIKAVIPAEKFEVLGDYLENAGVTGSEQLQIVDTSTGLVLLTTTSEATLTESDQELVGGDALQAAVAYLSQRFNEDADPETLAQELQSQYSLEEVAVENYIREGGDNDGGDELIIASFISGDKEYTIAPIPGTDWVSVASIDSSEVQAAGSELVGVFLLTALVLGGAATAMILFLARRLSEPLANLANAAEEVAAGNLDVQAEPRGAREPQTLAQSFNNLVTQVKDLLRKQEAEAKRERILAEVANAREAQELQSSLTKLLLDVRTALNTDRTVVYRFDQDWNGKVIAESVAEGWPQALDAQINDPCFANNYVGKYKQGRVHVLDNIYEAGLTECYLKQLEPFKVKANLVVPIVNSASDKEEGELFGLLIAHQCSEPRHWQSTEIDYLKGVAEQLEVVLRGFTLLQLRQAEAQRERQDKETLQKELFKLLNDVEGASSGDLTVRAEISAGEIGIIADFFNAIVENLRGLVTQVKQAATQVNSSVGENEGSISRLATEAIKQANQISTTLNSVEEMTRSIQDVADNARQAADVARTASTTAETGGEAMDRTVESILQLRETVAETAKKVKRLGESSQQISKVISLINQIALKTNLLAVNASIEAARAGEEGRGFAVVAEEVGELAAQSATATKEIEKIVENIQLETSQVVEAMEQGTAQVVEGTKLVAQTKESLEQIVGVSRQIDQLLQSISQATISQAQTSQSVTSLMGEISQLSGRTSDTSRLVSSSLRETVAIAQQLQTSVETFKVESEK